MSQSCLLVFILLGNGGWIGHGCGHAVPSEGGVLRFLAGTDDFSEGAYHARFISMEARFAILLVSRFFEWVGRNIMMSRLFTASLHVWDFPLGRLFPLDWSRF